MGLNPFKKPSYVGIDIGHHAIKAVQIDRVGQGWKISRAGWVRTPEDSVKEGVVVDAPAVAAAIRQVMRESHIAATAACIAVAGGSVVVRNVRIPKMPEATLRKSIKYEAGRYVPSSVEDSYIEFEIVGEADDNQMDVLIVAAPKEIVESRVKACEAAGLEVEVVDVEAFASYRCLLECDPANAYQGQTIAIVDIGGSTTSMSVISQGTFAMARSLSQGGQTWTDALKNYFRLSEDDAESGKAQLDLSELADFGSSSRSSMTLFARFAGPSTTSSRRRKKAPAAEQSTPSFCPAEPQSCPDWRSTSPTSSGFRPLAWARSITFDSHLPGLARPAMVLTWRLHPVWRCVRR